MHIADKSKSKISVKQIKFLNKLKELDKYYSDKKLGAFVENGKTFFRLFAPSAVKIFLVTFSSVEDSIGNSFEMVKDENAVWEYISEGGQYGLFYGFKVYHTGDLLDDHVELSLDPYSKAVATYNTYFNPRKSIIAKENDYDWEGDTRITKDWRDLVIYEMHVRDMTAHPSSGADEPGTYHGLIEKGKAGGIDYIKNLGVNTVELLPAQEFGNIESPYENSLHGKYNTWNPYEINHWGYMTAAFFAPEAYYSINTKKIEWNKWHGESARQINDFKDMVKAFHKEGIAVMMDVVYNHISEYELGNLKQIDKEYYFRLDEKGNYISESYTGNDFKTERPMSRRMIIDSILYWMKEYHIDGFRFDLAKLIDWETIEEVTRQAGMINPHVIFVAEPWGGGYDPMGFSLRGWGSWNDQFRNGIKGENPGKGQGWIFGHWYAHNNPDRIKSYLKGTLVNDEHGLFQKKEHSVNYLESHDGYTLGDFIRIGNNELIPDKIVKDLDKHTKLNMMQIKLNKLAALFLFASQGIIMIHEGQEYARSKVIFPDENIHDNNKGKMDHNSYEKDNETNYLNYNHVKLNEELYDYYKGLIALRNKYRCLRHADYNDIKFIDIDDNQFAFCCFLQHNNENLMLLFNADSSKEQEFDLPDGEWNVLADSEKAGPEPLRKISGSIILSQSTGAVLEKV
ncbi:MAG: alpha-amylase family glycosyl hydrolase [Ignavibacteriaceae bacterium]